MSAPDLRPSATVISLSDRIAAKSAKASALLDVVSESALSDALSSLGYHLEIASMRARRAGDDAGGAHLWRTALAARETAERAERLERKYRKAKKKAKRH